MKIAILQCDTVVDALAPEFGSYSVMIECMLAASSNGHEYVVFDVEHGEYPPDVDAFDGFITTGSRAGVYEQHPWIGQLIEFLRLLDRKRKKLFGICFGHQLIAFARGGTVARSEKGWGVGIAENDILDHPDWMDRKSGSLNLIVSHQDQITQLSADSTVIAASDFCPYFMVQWSDCALSVQGHPEWSRAYSKALMLNRRSRIGDQRIETGLASLAIEPDNELFARWIWDFFEHSGCA